MPVAVVTDRGGERHELKSCPGAYVVLRQMTYGEWQKRSDIVTRLTIENADRGRRSNRARGDSVTRIDMQSLEVAIFEFKTCVIDHNLEDEGGRKLDLTAPFDLQRLDPRIGDEITRLIEKLNTWDEEDEENFPSKSEGSSSPTTQVASNSARASTSP